MKGTVGELRGDYGVDELRWPLLLGLVGVLWLMLGLVSVSLLALPVLGVICFICSAFFLFSAASYVYTTCRGKFQVWSEILHQLGLRGDEQLLDLGCCRGAVLLMAAHLLPRGKATGIDVWKVAEQSGNALSATQRNAELEGVASRVVLETADMGSCRSPPAPSTWWFPAWPSTTSAIRRDAARPSGKPCACSNLVAGSQSWTSAKHRTMRNGCASWEWVR
jgi:hypothetical protein